MKKILKVLGCIFAAIAILGGLQLMIREGFASYTIGAFLTYVALSVLCFWGSNKIKK